jgi:hypothetical protein
VTGLLRGVTGGAPAFAHELPDPMGPHPHTPRDPTLMTWQAFAHELQTVGVDAATLPAYALLQEAVRPEEGLVGSVAGA